MATGERHPQLSLFLMDRPMTSDVRRRGEGPGRNSENGTLRPPDENRFISQNRILSDGGNRRVSSQIWAGRGRRRGVLVRLELWCCGGVVGRHQFTTN